MRIRRCLFILAIVFVTGCATALWIVTAPRPAFSAKDTASLNSKGDPARGRLVFAAGDCSSCHASPGQTDPLRLGGGLALASPYGTFRAPNISPDPKDGIGTWSTVDLANALISGVSPERKHYYPVFPYSSFTHMRANDVADLMAYLRTLPPVSGRAPPHDLALLFRIRRVIGLWKFLYFDRSPITPDPSHDLAWNRGRYLVEGIAHCAECHSSRNILGAIKPETRFAGGQDPEGVGYVPNITPTRVGDWTEQNIIELLKTGSTPNHGRVGSSMTDVVTNTAKLPLSDLLAIATYIKSLRPRATPRP